MSGDDVTKRMYNGVDYRHGWPTYPTYPLMTPSGTRLPEKKPWWRRLLGIK